MVNLFNMDFGTIHNTPFNRFEGAIPSKNYRELKDFEKWEVDETNKGKTPAPKLVGAWKQLAGVGNLDLK